MINSKAQKLSFPLSFFSSSFVFVWCIIAAFPIFWITVMSVKIPIDAFSSNPFIVIFGPETIKNHTSWSYLNLFFSILYIYITFIFYKQIASYFSKILSFNKFFSITIILIFSLIILYIFNNLIVPELNPILGVLGNKVIGFTFEYYNIVWFERGFLNNFKNSIIVTSGVVIISLTFGTLAGFALARTKSSIAFWILVAALIFRSLPHSVLVAGYLPFFVNSSEIMRPIFGDFSPTLYGKPFAVIAVLVAINQPFTIWMMRSFFQNIPSELDEAARIDGCSHFQAFIKIILPVMWPGVITTGLFSFMLGYNDYLVTSLLLDGPNQTMVPAISGLFNRDTTSTDQIVAIAAAVSITAPLFFLVLFFQRQIVSGLTAGAVKG